MADPSSRRAKNPTESTVRRLFAAQSTCAYPDCDAPLVVEDSGGRTSINVEIAHIIAASPNGPRPADDEDEETLRSFDNLLLLCGTHHKLVDDHWQDYPAEALREWKRAARSERDTAPPALEPTTDQVQEMIRGMTVTMTSHGDKSQNIGVIEGDVTLNIE